MAKLLFALDSVQNIMEKNEITSLIVVDRKKSLSGLLTLNLLLKKGIE
jgi:CBS domain-containing protein